MRSGVIPSSARQRSIPTWTAPRLAPPDITNAVVIAHPRVPTSEQCRVIISEFTETGSNMDPVSMPDWQGRGADPS